ncbi:hypothetical protein LTR37_007202 [Vermiconidia calcicola]|uniref:Uncharacterized protein n=1 Tax=Vermiconidia calcicola TaxID=1690605 RepID=A0ACC3NF39_9PEZI|nr:hypothetical protein LTR37_007202 [Vermiconidia calcicola]
MADLMIDSAEVTSTESSGTTSTWIYQPGGPALVNSLATGKLRSISVGPTKDSKEQLLSAVLKSELRSADEAFFPKLIRSPSLEPGPFAHEYSYFDDLKLERVNILSRADHSRKLPRFMELPPELRTIIYHYASVSKIPLQRPKVPATCRLSKGTREEALPMFFASNSFMITIQAKVTLPYSSTGSPKVIKASEIKSEDKKWLRMMRQHVSLMRRFTINVAEQINPASRTLGERYFLTEIAFTPSMNGACFSHVGSFERDLTKHAEVVPSVKEDTTVPDELDDVLKHIVSSGAIKNKLGVILQLFLAAF